MARASVLAKQLIPPSMSLGEEGANFLVSKFPQFNTLQDVYKALARAHCGFAISQPPAARSREKKIDMLLEQAFFPTGVELEGGLRLLSAIEMTTQARGNDLVEINQHYAQVSFNSQTHAYSLAQAQSFAPYRRWIVVCAPISMLVEKLLYALRSLLGPLHRHESVVRHYKYGDILQETADVKQIPLLIVQMPTRATESGLYFSVLNALIPFVGEASIEREGLRRRRLESYVPTLVRALLSLHVGAIAIVGMREIHAQPLNLPYFYAALEWLAASGIAIFLCTSPALLSLEDAGLSPLRHTTESPIIDDTYADADLPQLATHWWALLDRTEKPPDAMVHMISNVNAQRDLILMLYRQLNYDLNVRKQSVDKALKNLEARACWSHSRQIELWKMPVIPYKDSLIYRDWMPLSTPIARPPRESRRRHRS